MTHPTQLAIQALELQIREATSGISTSLESWQSQAAEERKATEDRIKTLEDTVLKLTAELEQRRRTSLPGSEPNAKSGERFSLARACIALSTRDWSNAGFEKEVFDNMRERAMSSGVDSAGGFIVPDEAIPQVIERLKAQVVSLQLGAREIPATGSPILIPRVGTSVTANWMTGENATITASDLGLQQISMTPKTLAARVVMSNQLMELSMPAADSIIETDMSSQLAIGLDQGVMEGSGASGEPLGIVNDADVNTQTWTDAQVTWAELIEFPNALAQDNALRGRLGWALHPTAFNQLRTVVNPTNIDIERRILSEGMPEMILGYPYRTTTSLTGASGVGAKSAIFGNWDDVLIAMWGGLRLRASDLSDDAFSKDQTHIRAIMRADTALRHPESMCVAS